MAGDLNARHLDCNSRLITKRRRRLRDYANDYSCLIYGPDTNNHYPHSSATPNVLENVLTKDLVTPMYLTTCSAHSSDHLLILTKENIDHSFLISRTTPISEGPTASNSIRLEARIPSTTKLRNRVEIATCVEEVSSAIIEALEASAPKSRPRDNPRPLIPARIQDDIRLKPG